jgi:hypothetical protein
VARREPASVPAFSRRVVRVDSLEFSRLAKLLVDAEGVTLAEANEKLRRLRLEVVVRDARSVSAQNALLTSVAVGNKTFVGGVRIRLDEDAPLATSLPIEGHSLVEAAQRVGATNFTGEVAATIVIGGPPVQGVTAVYPWWEGWNAGASEQPRQCDVGDNPLSGIVAGATAVARCFGQVRGQEMAASTDVDLWPSDGTACRPTFEETYFPKAIWLLGIGNLGQAYLWSLAALPFSSPAEVLLVLQDRDKISTENWGTSILVGPDHYGLCKTAIGEQWGNARKFDIRRCDRWLDEHQRQASDEPALALCGFDSFDARLLLDNAGFDLIVDSGLGREAANFDRFRTTILDRDYPAKHHFAGQKANTRVQNQDYSKLLETDACGAAIFESIAIAAPYVSAVAGAVAIARLIAICSGASVPRTETRRLRDEDSRGSGWVKPSSRRILRTR